LKPTTSEAELKEYFLGLILTEMSKIEICYLDPLLGDDISAVTSRQSLKESFLIENQNT
jgi:hypothetical protein